MNLERIYHVRKVQPKIQLNHNYLLKNITIFLKRQKDKKVKKNKKKNTVGQIFSNSTFHRTVL